MNNETAAGKYVGMTLVHEIPRTALDDVTLRPRRTNSSLMPTILVAYALRSTMT